ncbi:MAG: transglutaminase N-terminal domain-containing protein, partial [Myxococcota bacterium]
TPMTVEGMQKQTMNDGMQAQTLPVGHSPAPTVSQPSPSSRPTDAPITAGNGTADASTPTTEPLAQTTESADRIAEGIESTNDDASAPRTEEAPANATLDERVSPTQDLPSFFVRTLGPGRTLTVEHTTTYSYTKPVERSTHLLRLQPIHDANQDLLEHSLRISTSGVERRYQDVFGNQALRIEIEQPFEQLQLSARSVVRVRSYMPADLQSPHRRFSIPLVWMPWQRQMMTPYLLPPELPETQLQELIDFAMNFVERQDFDLVQTLIDMNTTIYRDFKYVSGSTTMATTPFQVFAQRRGVCQDFANLLICLARLLNVPARYRVGYIYTGTNYENTVQSDASHAWAELYLPWSGWQGFDPTNGCLVNRDHIRVACGRNYGDATPTSGTIYKGGSNERLQVDVKVIES